MITKISDFVIESGGKSISSISTDLIAGIVGIYEIPSIYPPENCVLISITEPDTKTSRV